MPSSRPRRSGEVLRSALEQASPKEEKEDVVRMVPGRMDCVCAALVLPRAYLRNSETAKI